MAKRRKKASRATRRVVRRVKPSQQSLAIWIILLLGALLFIHQFAGSTTPGEKEEVFGDNDKPPMVECISPYILHGDACCPDLNEDGVCDVIPSTSRFEEDIIDYPEEFHLASLQSFVVKSVSSLPGSLPVALGGNVGVDDDPQLGNPAAPVAVIEFSNYECIPCIDAYKHLFPALKQEYIDTGKVLYVTRDYVYETGASHEAFRAAVAANCAREQGKFWEMRDLLFKNTKHFSPATLTDHAKKLGLDLPRFRICLDDGYQNEIKKDYQDGKAAGMQAGALAYYVNGFSVLSSDYDRVKETIDNVLSGKWK